MTAQTAPQYQVYSHGVLIQSTNSHKEAWDTYRLSSASDKVIYSLVSGTQCTYAPVQRYCGIEYKKDKKIERTAKAAVTAV